MLVCYGENIANKHVNEYTYIQVGTCDIHAFT